MYNHLRQHYYTLQMVFKIVQQRKYEKKTLLGNGIECTLTQSHDFPLIHVPCIGSFKLASD